MTENAKRKTPPHLAYSNRLLRGGRIHPQRRLAQGGVLAGGGYFNGVGNVVNPSGTFMMIGR